MTTLPDSNHENAYVLGAENAAEMARIIDQDRLVTQSMGGLFPERDDNLEEFHNVLDIACGPGSWTNEVALTYPHLQVTGVDISRIMINYANAQAKVRKLPNAHFKVMDVLQPLDFPPESFDLVNARFLLGFMSREDWPRLVQECKRILRPGGVLRLTDSEGFGVINSPAMSELSEISLRTMYKAGRSFTPEGRSYGLTPMLEMFLRRAGFVDIHRMAHAVSFSYGAELHDMTCNNFLTALQLLRPFVAKVGVVSTERYDQLYEEAQREMLSEDFAAISYALTAWGSKTTT